MADEHNHHSPTDNVDESYDPYDSYDGAGATTWRAEDESPDALGPRGGADEVAEESVADDARDDNLFRGSSASAADASTGRGAWASDAAAASAAPAASHEAVRAERERLQAERTARRDARLAALAPAPHPDPAAGAAAASRGTTANSSLSPIPSEPVVTERIVTRRSTDRFGPALGLFLLRLVVAAIMGVHGIQKLLNLPGTTAMLQQTLIPYPSIMAIVIGAAEIAIAIALVFGLLTRIAGLGVLLIAGGALAFVLWGTWNPFVAGQSGFTGELELLLAAVGLLLLFTGGGGWAVDRGFRARRAADRELREA